MTDSHIICAYEIDGSGRGIPLHDDAEIFEKLKATNLAWAHLDASHSDTRGWLEDNISYLDDLILDALLAEETRPRMLEHKDGLLLILRGVNLNENANAEDMISIRLWIDEHRIISTRKRKLRAITDIRNKLEQGTGPKDSGHFLSMLSGLLTQRMEPVLSELDEETDAIEEAILEDPDLEERQTIIDIRKRAILFRRYISPQKDAVAQLRLSEVAWLSAKDKRALQENADRLMRYVEDLDAIRERAQIVKDELANIVADKMNRNTYILSIVAAIFLPLGFLTGLLGINVGGMPGADNDIAFWIVCLLCGLFAGLLMLIFRSFKWF